MARASALIAFALAVSVVAAPGSVAPKIEVFTLADGRTLTGTYDEAGESLALSGVPGNPKLHIATADIVKREAAAAPAAAPAARDPEANPDDPELAATDLEAARKKAARERMKERVAAHEKEVVAARERAKFWFANGAYRFDPETMTADDMDKRVVFLQHEKEARAEREHKAAADQAAARAAADAAAATSAGGSGPYRPQRSGY